MTLLDVVTIDGPAGSGKSTLAKRVAAALGWAYLDSGSLYRAIAYLLIQKNVPPLSGHCLQETVAALPFSLRRQGEVWVPYGAEEELRPYLRTPEVSQGASVYAALPEVRHYLLEAQRKAGREGQLVCDGRDMGSVVFPTARYKIYLDASPITRAKRRLLELEETFNKSSKNKENIKDFSFEAVLSEMTERDRRDQDRTMAPLVIPPGAHVVDTSDKTIDEVLKILLNFIDKGGEAPL